MKSVFAASLFLLLFVTSNSYSTIRTVNQFGTAQFVTISDAINASVSGDTILIAPGTYTESPQTSNRRLHIIGAGWDVTTINGGFAFNGNATSSRSIIEGLRIESTGGAAFNISQATSDSMTVRRCLLRGSGNTASLSGLRAFFEDCILVNSTSTFSDLVALSTIASSNTIFRSCVFTYQAASPSSSANAFSGANSGTLEVTNCVFVNIHTPFNLTGTQPVIAINNVFYDWLAGGSWGTFLAGSVFDYTAADNTAPAFPAAFTNNVALAANNPFVNYTAATNYVIGTSDLHLNGGAGGLALTNTGHPLILDLDASRSDIGAYGGPKPLVDNGIPAFPFATSLTIPNLLETGDSLSVSSTGRVGPRY